MIYFNKIIKFERKRVTYGIALVSDIAQILPREYSYEYSGILMNWLKFEPAL